LIYCIQNNISPPPKSVVITFDDGYANNATLAAEELNRWALPWSEFLPARLIEHQERQWIDDLYMLIHAGSCKRLKLDWDGMDSQWPLDTLENRRAAAHFVIQALRYCPEAIRLRRFAEVCAHYSQDEVETLRARFTSFAPMTWQQARALQSAGVDVGSHSFSHIALAPQDPVTIREELAQARTLIQERLGDHSPHFSYPYGRPSSISSETEEAIADMGYACAVTLEQQIIDCENCKLLELPRLIVSTQAGRILYTLWQRFNR
jgi:peptidoglycan/xylan/chitin deacetylase (PgdA/CDA1 family)